MKRANLISILVIILSLTVTAESRGQRQSVNNDFIKVDVTKSYSQKKELILQDFMDVEYIPLETNDEFVNQGLVQDIGKKFIVVINKNRDGDIFIYDRTGKAIRKINRKGQGPEEYPNILGITLDEDNNEMFVSGSRKTVVYDLYGKFKRSFNHKKDTKTTGYFDIFNYDKDNLICYDKHNEEIAFVLISKQDGSIIKEIKIPFKKKKLLMQFSTKGSATTAVGPPDAHHSIIPFKGDWILLELSSDTVYTFLPDYSLCTIS